MASYRFCRTDDIPLLVRAYESCYRVHFPGLPALTAEGFKRLTREYDLWCSSCMVAVVADEPVGVLFATKRDTEALIWCIGIHPEHRRSGHGKHLLTSLSAKLAILGPPRLLGEIPGDSREARTFFEACGYRHEVDYTDLVLDAAPRPPLKGRKLLTPVRFEELQAAGVFASVGTRAWERTVETLDARKEALNGIAVASAERYEAWVLWEDDHVSGERRVLTLGVAEQAHSSTWLDLLLRACTSDADRPVRIPRVHPAELPLAPLHDLGFRPAGITAAYIHAATPG